MFKMKKSIGAAFALVFLFCAIVTAFPAQAATVKTPSADGTVTYGNDKTTIDASHTANGYVMVRYTGKAAKIKVRITKSAQYVYDLNTSGQYETFPLTEGNGSYTVEVLENVTGNQYAMAYSKSVPVNLADERDPFLYPNQFCNFNANSAIIGIADTVTAGATDTIKKVEAVYKYTVDNISYDNQKAASVQSGYLPNIDNTLAQKKGICFDYAAVMTAMLRVEGVPTKLVIGYTGDVYHAWVSVYADEQGWIDNVIFFDGTDWRFMDPTFASTGKGDSSVNAYISNAANYRAKFTY